MYQEGNSTDDPIGQFIQDKIKQKHGSSTRISAKDAPDEGGAVRTRAENHRKYKNLHVHQRRENQRRRQRRAEGIVSAEKAPEQPLKLHLYLRNLIQCSSFVSSYHKKATS